MTDGSETSGGRDVIGVILAFRRALSEVPSGRRPEAAAEYLCDLFDGSMAALNLMDYGASRFHTITNVGSLVAGEQRSPTGEYYSFVDYSFTTQQLARGASYRSAVDDPACPPEYRELLTAQRRTDCLGAPIRLAGSPLGEFWVARNNGKPFDAADEDLAVACGATLARFCRPSWAVAG